jgi:hypothetical protein
MTSTHQVLSDDQVSQFNQDGFVKVERAFPGEFALAAQDYLWDRLSREGILKNEPATWTQPMAHLKESYDDPVFQRCLTDRLAGAIEDLIGPGRWVEDGRTRGWGWWPVNFSLGADKPWTVPTNGWHWDGIHFKHTVDAPNQGLLVLATFSEIAPRGGGTLVAAGSHRIVARFLAKHEEGLELSSAIKTCVAENPWLNELSGGTQQVADRVAYFMEQDHLDETGQPLRVVEATASPGDVYLCHPFLFHAASQNHSGAPRFMCNRTTPMTRPMNVRELTKQSSPVEVSIYSAIHASLRVGV